MIDLKNAYEIRNVLNDKVIEKIEDEFGNIIYEAFKLLTASGIPPLTLNKCKGVGLADYKIYGNSIQDGTPTPDNPIGIQSVGDYDKITNKYKIPVTVRGKNLARCKAITRTMNGVRCTVNEDKSITLNGTNTGDNFTFPINLGYPPVERTVPIKGNTTYTLSGGVPLPDGIYLQAYGPINGSTAYKTFKQTPTVFKTVEDGLWGFYLRVDAGMVLDNLTVYPQLEVGNKATDYEPYIEPITTNIYANEPLRRVGDYVDYIDFKNQKVIRNVEELIITGSETTWENAGSIDRFKIDSNRICDNVGGNSANQLCNYFKCDNVVTSNNAQGVSVYYSASLGGTYFRIRDVNNFETGSASKIEFFKEKYNDGTPCKILFDLYTPKEETIELPSIPTHKGTTIIEIDTSVTPSNMEVEYYGKGVS